jgi:HSP20 family protein
MRTRTNPWRNLSTWQNTFDQMFEDSFNRTFAPWANQEDGGWQNLDLDVSENEDNLLIEASLPGINPDDVEISVHNNILTIKGETKFERENGDGKNGQDEDNKYHLRERRYGSFYRTVQLPLEVNADQAEANFKNGVLHLTLPKVEEVKPKRISVKAS